MKIAKLLGWMSLGCAAFALSGCLFHRPAYYPAQVLMKGGAPCFSVANNRKERINPPIISIISVFPYASEEVMPLWCRAFPRNQPSMKLSPHECLTYDGEAGLQKGLPYVVFMNGYIHEENRRYRAYFCLHEANGGSTEIHYSKWSNKMNGYDWQTCGQQDQLNYKDAH